MSGIHRIETSLGPVQAAFDADGAACFLLDALRQLVGDRRDMTRRPAARDHHMIGDAALAGKRDGNGFLGLVLVQLVEDQRVERVHAVARRLGSGCGAGRGILAGGYQAVPFLSETPRRERVIGSRGARPS